jgi:hypothetical protein
VGMCDTEAEGGSQAACVEALELRPPDLDPAGASGDYVGGGAVEAKGGGEAERGRVSDGGREASIMAGAGGGQRGRERNVRGKVRDWMVVRWRGMECGRRRRTMRYGRSRSMDGRTVERGRQTTLVVLICSRDIKAARR